MNKRGMDLLSQAAGTIEQLDDSFNPGDPGPNEGWNDVGAQKLHGEIVDYLNEPKIEGSKMIVTDLVGKTAEITHGEQDIQSFVSELGLNKNTCSPLSHSIWYIGAHGQIVAVYLNNAGLLVVAISLLSNRPGLVCGGVKAGTVAIVSVEHINVSP